MDLKLSAHCIFLNFQQKIVWILEFVLHNTWIPISWKAECSQSLPTKATKNFAGPLSICYLSHGQPPSVPNRYLIQHFYFKIPKVGLFPSIFGVKLWSPFRVHLRTRNKTKRREPITTTTRRTLQKWIKEQNCICNFWAIDWQKSTDLNVDFEPVEFSNSKSCQNATPRKLPTWVAGVTQIPRSLKR